MAAGERTVSGHLEDASGNVRVGVTVRLQPRPFAPSELTVAEAAIHTDRRGIDSSFLSGITDAAGFVSISFTPPDDIVGGVLPYRAQVGDSPWWDVAFTDRDYTLAEIILQSRVPVEESDVTPAVDISVRPSDLNATNEPEASWVATKDENEDRFTWAEGGSGGGGSMNVAGATRNLVVRMGTRLSDTAFVEADFLSAYSSVGTPEAIEWAPSDQNQVYVAIWIEGATAPISGDFGFGGVFFPEFFGAPPVAGTPLTIDGVDGHWWTNGELTSSNGYRGFGIIIVLIFPAVGRVVLHDGSLETARWTSHTWINSANHENVYPFAPGIADDEHGFLAVSVEFTATEAPVDLVAATGIGGTTIPLEAWRDITVIEGTDAELVRADTPDTLLNCWPFLISAPDATPSRLRIMGIALRPWHKAAGAGTDEQFGCIAVLAGSLAPARLYNVRMTVVLFAD